MNGPCEEFADRIVDYVDGELPEAEARMVARHLAACEPCRRTVEALNQSLVLAKTVWSSNLGERRRTRVIPVSRTRRIRAYCVAAAILVVASTLLLTVSNHSSPQPSIRPDEVERQVSDAGAAAQLLAATHILARCEGTESIVEEQCRYILSNYPGTPAAATLVTSNPFRRN